MHVVFFKATTRQTTLGKGSKLQPIARIPRLPDEFTETDLTKMLVSPPCQPKHVPTATVS